MDALDAAGLRATVVAAAPDAVVHMLTDLSTADGAANGRLRRAGTHNLVDAARTAGVGRLVAQSIAWVYAPGEDPAGESVPLGPDARAPRGPMVAAVDALERTSVELGGRRPALRGALRAGRLVRAGRRGGAARRTGPPSLGSLAPDASVGSFVQGDDAAAAVAAALDWPPDPVNGVDDAPAPARLWVPVLADAVGARAPAPTESDERPGWARGARDDLARSRGWHPTHPT